MDVIAALGSVSLTGFLSGAIAWKYEIVNRNCDQLIHVAQTQIVKKNLFIFHHRLILNSLIGAADKEM